MHAVLIKLLAIAALVAVWVRFLAWTTHRNQTPLTPPRPRERLTPHLTRLGQRISVGHGTEQQWIAFANRWRTARSKDVNPDELDDINRERKLIFRAMESRGWCRDAQEAFNQVLYRMDIASLNTFVDELKPPD